MKSLRTRYHESKAKISAIKRSIFRQEPIKELELDSNRMPVQFSIIVPSTIGDKEIPAWEFEKRIADEKQFLTERFQGDTAFRTEGDYFDVNHVVTEKGVMIQVSTSREKYEQMRNELTEHIRLRKDEWGQSTIGYGIEGNFYIYPRQENLSHDTAKNIEVK